jgi:hypothetical protein
MCRRVMVGVTGREQARIGCDNSVSRGKSARGGSEKTNRHYTPESQKRFHISCKLP